jgi:hypothetical protein
VSKLQGGPPGERSNTDRIYTQRPVPVNGKLVLRSRRHLDTLTSIALHFSADRRMRAGPSHSVTPTFSEFQPIVFLDDNQTGASRKTVLNGTTLGYIHFRGGATQQAMEDGANSMKLDAVGRKTGVGTQYIQ